MNVLGGVVEGEKDGVNCRTELHFRYRSGATISDVREMCSIPFSKGQRKLLLLVMQ